MFHIKSDKTIRKSIVIVNFDDYSLRGRQVRHYINSKVKGMGKIGGKHIMIFGNATYFVSLVAHELGHNLGLGEKYNTSTLENGPDLYNTMNNTWSKSNLFRRDQWTIMTR